MSTGKEKLKKINNKINKNEQDKFIRLKMWLSYIVSLTIKDRGTIPENIGNKILILNNMYVTKQFLTTVIHLVELSLDTPITLLGEMVTNELRRNNNSAMVDFIIKNQRKDIDLNDAGLKSRIDLWERSGDNKYLLEKNKKRAVRLLYTIDQVREGQELMESRIFLKVMSKNGTELNDAEKIIYKYLASIGCIFKPINSSLKDYLSYISLISNYRSKNIKQIPSVINSNKTLSQLLPNTHSPGNNKGILLGINAINNFPYRIDLRKISMARNIYCLTGSGGGKTVLAINACSSALEEGFHICIMDIKGNEFNTVVESVNGATISLREKSNEYINTFIMLKEESTDENSDMYFKNRINFSKKQMIILSGISDSTKINILDGFLDEFLDYLYISLGVKSNNRNTWDETLKLNPYIIYEYIENYINKGIKEKYKDIITYITTNLKMYFSKNGSKSYIFTKELQYKDLLDRKALRFDFGMISNSGYDNTIFKLKFEYMSRINEEYVTKKYNQNIDTFKILEESQSITEDVMSLYAREYTLRRAQNQSTLLLGNSIDALIKSNKSMPLIETTTGILVGKLNKTTLELFIKHFDVGNKEGIIRHMSKDNSYMRHFLFINNMEPKSLTPILKLELDSEVKYKAFTPVKEII